MYLLSSKNEFQVKCQYGPDIGRIMERYDSYSDNK